MIQTFWRILQFNMIWYYELPRTGQMIDIDQKFWITVWLYMRRTTSINQQLYLRLNSTEYPYFKMLLIWINPCCEIDRSWLNEESVINSWFRFWIWFLSKITSDFYLFTQNRKKKKLLAILFLCTCANCESRSIECNRERKKLHEKHRLDFE